MHARRSRGFKAQSKTRAVKADVTAPAPPGEGLRVDFRVGDPTSSSTMLIFAAFSRRLHRAGNLIAGN